MGVFILVFKKLFFITLGAARCIHVFLREKKRVKKNSKKLKCIKEILGFFNEFKIVQENKTKRQI